MLGLGGELGKNSLGLFELGTVQTHAPFVPHRGRPRSTLSRAGLNSIATRTGLRSSVSRTKIGSEVGGG